MKLTSKTRIHVAGHTGLVGSALVRALEARGCTNLILADRHQLDLRNRTAVHQFYADQQPEMVVMAAGLVGGIQANIDDPVGFFTDNMLMAESVISAAHAQRVGKLLYIGSSCIYPKNAELPLQETALLTGAFEPSNEGYAMAKSMAIRLCQYHQKQFGSNFITCLPTNVYGPGDRYNDRKSHVVPALIQRIHKAKLNGDQEVVVWGTGKPLRDLIYCDDLAAACLVLLEQYNGSDPVNMASGTEHSIAELVHTIAQVIGYTGALLFDHSKPDGIFRKPQDLTKIHALGWEASTPLHQGITIAYTDYLERYANVG